MKGGVKKQMIAVIIILGFIGLILSGDITNMGGKK